MRPISEIAESMGLDRQTIIPYGHYKAKIPLEAIRSDGRRGKLVLVTAMTPTRVGEGKTTTTIGLTQGLGRLGQSAVATIREPSLGPIFGIKGGGTGGDKARVEPEDEVNIHLTGDAHAVGSAHNLLAALTDNAVQRGQVPGLDPSGITWRRVTDVEDRALRSIVTGIGGSANRPVRETGFDIVTASEIMAVLALSTDLEDLRTRLSRMVVGLTDDGSPVTADDVEAVGSMMSLLRYAIQPNLVQTTEGQPAMVHTGPFGNIAHGCSSVVADRLALGYADYVVTEAGFGADLGFEKFMHIKARFNDLEPDAVVMVATVKALKSHGGGAAPRPRRSQRGRAAKRHGQSPTPDLGRALLQTAGRRGDQPVPDRHRTGDRRRKGDVGELRGPRGRGEPGLRGRRRGRRGARRGGSWTLRTMTAVRSRTCTTRGRPLARRWMCSPKGSMEPTA